MLLIVEPDYKALRMLSLSIRTCISKLTTGACDKLFVHVDLVGRRSSFVCMNSSPEGRGGDVEAKQTII